MELPRLTQTYVWDHLKEERDLAIQHLVMQIGLLVQTFRGERGAGREGTKKRRRRARCF